jgi:glycosyltransferase involved in cell wall biosynthesis
MSNNPLISVILPVYNNELYVAEALNSILNQTYKNIEIICINDGSTDKSGEILNSFADKITLINNPKNEGIAASRNNGIARATGTFLAFMDGDDIWGKNKLEIQMQEFTSHPELDILLCSMTCFISPELPEEIKKLRHCPQGIIPGFLSAAAVVKTDVFHAVGLFDTAWTVGEFVDWLERAKNKGHRYKMVEEVLLLRRIHDTNTGIVARSSRQDYVKIVKSALDRKRSK